MERLRSLNSAWSLLENRPKCQKDQRIATSVTVTSAAVSWSRRALAEAQLGVVET